MLVPKGLGVAVSSTGVVRESRIFGQQRGGFLNPLRYENENYAAALRKLYLDTAFFAGDLELNRV